MCYVKACGSTDLMYSSESGAPVSAAAIDNVTEYEVHSVFCRVWIPMLHGDPQADSAADQCRS